MTDWKKVLDSILENSSHEKPLLTSKAYETLGLPRLKKWEPGDVLAEWAFDERMGNSRGELFGGFYAVLADEVSALAAMSVMKPNEIMKTLDLRVSFFRPLTEGIVKIRAFVLNRSGSAVHVEAEFHDQQGKLLAKAFAIHKTIEAE